MAAERFYRALMVSEGGGRGLREAGRAVSVSQGGRELCIGEAGRGVPGVREGRVGEESAGVSGRRADV